MSKKSEDETPVQRTRREVLDQVADWFDEVERAGFGAYDDGDEDTITISVGRAAYDEQDRELLSIAVTTSCRRCG